MRNKLILAGAADRGPGAGPRPLERMVEQSMKKAVVIFTMLCLWTVSASAAYIPEDVITEKP